MIMPEAYDLMGTLEDTYLNWKHEASEVLMPGGWFWKGHLDSAGAAEWPRRYEDFRNGGLDHETAKRKCLYQIDQIEIANGNTNWLVDPVTGTQTPRFADQFAPKPIPDSPLRQLQGQLYINGRGLHDAAGPVTPTTSHDGHGLWSEKFEAEKAHRWNREMRAAGYQAKRVFCTLAWPNGQAVNPVDCVDFAGVPRSAWPDYMDVFHSMLNDLREVGLKLDLSFGDLQQLFRSPDQMRAWVSTLGRNIRQWGHSDTIAWFQVNEWWQNCSRDVDTVRWVLEGMAAELPGVLWGNGAGEGGEAEVASYRQGVPLAILHPDRIDPGPDFTNQIRRGFTVGKDGRSTQPICVTEPIGQGTSGRGTLDGPGLAMHAVAYHLGGIPYTWICGAGIWGRAGSDAGVAFPAELKESAGFYDVPRLVALLPADLPVFPRMKRGGQGDEIIYQEGGYYSETGWGAGRVDSAESDTGGANGRGSVVTLVHHVENRVVDRLKARAPLGRVRVYAATGALIAEGSGRIPPFNQRALIVADRA